MSKETERRNEARKIAKLLRHAKWHITEAPKGWGAIRPLTKPEAAAYIGTSTLMLDKYRRHGLPSHETNELLWFDPAEVQAWMQSGDW